MRKEDDFDQINLGQLFAKEITTFLARVGSSPQDLARVLEGDLANRLMALL